MITLKCKSCGDIISVDSNESYVICPSCGNVYNVPTDEKKEQYLNLYSRADDAWDHKDFEEASDIYQQILNGDNTQAEAHFGMVLCKYGITYEIDPVTQKKMPTCNRINRDSILDDKHFLAAMKYASKDAAASFKNRAQEIDRISRDFLKIVDKEPPYDVFISYKRTADDGTVTQDSKVARKLYFHLKEKGFKIFFAEETLKSIAGEKYEPYIFAALSSAPVMILVGSRRDYFEATWVKNEWRRYLGLMNQGLKKTLIPAYFDMDPYHMPGELRNLQAMNAADFTFHEDLTEIIRKKLADVKEEKPAPETKGQSLRDKYAPKAKVDKLVNITDCDREFAINVLVQCHGDIKQSQQFIEEDPEYKRSLWFCAECNTNNTHDKCRNCGTTKKESIEVARARKEMEDRKRKKSNEYKRKMASRFKKVIAFIVFAPITLAALVGVFFLLKWAAFKPEDIVMSICAPTAIVLSILALIMKRILTGKGGIVFLFASYFVIAVTLVIAFFGSRFIFIRDVDDLYTPEIVQSYCDLNEECDTILTITECSQSGQVIASWESIWADGGYCKYALTGQIVSKKNNGDIEIEWTSNVAEFASDNWQEETRAFITEKYTVLNTDSGFTLKAGVNDKYAIKTAADLSKLVNAKGAFQLMNDIDMSGVSHAPIDGFTGILMGNGHTIKNLKIESSESNVGFFSTLNGIVRDLKFENAQINVTGSQENVGILCGTLGGSASDIVVSGSVDAENAKNIGGIAGNVSSSRNVAMNSLENSASVSGDECVGGIFGCYFVNSNYSEITTQLNSFKNSGSVMANGDYAGGMIGTFEGDQENSYRILHVSNFANTGSIKGELYVGGLFGYSFVSAESTIKNSSNSSAIEGEAYVGCVAGSALGITVSDCKNSGSTLTATKYVTQDGVKYAYVGGFVGEGYGAINCTNEVEINYTAGGRYVGGIIGGVTTGRDRTMTGLRNTANISGADYVGGIIGNYYISSNYNDRTTQFDDFENSGAITASGQCVGGMIGSFGGDQHDRRILYVSDCTNTGDVKGTINVGGIFGYAYATNGSYIKNSSNSSAIEGEAYVGCIAGSALCITVTDCENGGSTLTATKYVTQDGVKYAYVGGFVGEGSEASDCTNEVDINYTAGGRYVGGIIGGITTGQDRTMTGLRNTANISGADYVGGIIGNYYVDSNYNDRTTQFDDLENSGNVTGTGNYIGGMIGSFDGDQEQYRTLYISDFANTGTVKGSKYVGGIVGYAHTNDKSYIQDSTTTSGKIAGELKGITVK